MADETTYTIAEKERIAQLVADGKKDEEAINQIKKERLLVERDSLKTLEDRVIKYEEYYKKLQQVEGIQNNDLLMGRQMLEINQTKLKLMEMEFKQAIDVTEARHKEYEELKNIVESQKEVLSTQNELNEEIGAYTDLQKKVYKNTQKWLVAMDEGKTIALAISKAKMGIDKAASKGISTLVNVTKDLIFSFDSVTKEFEKATQLNKSYTKSIEKTYTELNIYGATLEEVSKAQTDLITQVSDYTLMQKGQRDALLEVGTVLGDLGIATQDYAQGVQNSIKYFSQSALGARSTALELKSTAEALGVIPGQMAAEYAKMGPALAKFGEQGVRAFKDLARIQKITGMEMQKVLNITNKFDTFEGAAEQAGKLNAALGGNFVNAMDLMMATDPAERFSMIRDSILDAGLSFDSMSYYQKQFYTESLGLSDVGDLALMLSGNMDTLGAATNQSAAELIAQKEKAQENMKIQEKLKSVFIEMGEALIPLAETLSDIATILQKKMWIVKTITGLFVAWKVVTALIAVQNAWLTVSMWGLAAGETAVEKSGRKAWIVMGLIALAAVAIGLAFMIMSPSKLVLAFFGFAAALYAVSKVGNKAAGTLQRLALPILQVGAGIAMAALSLAAMAAAFSLLDVAQMAGMGAILVAMGVGAYFLAPALSALGIALINPAVAGGLLVFGATILMIGGAIGIAAAGIGLMAMGFAKLFEAIDLPKLLGVGLFMAGIVLGAPFLFLGAAGLAAMGAGFFAMAVGLALLSRSKLRSVADFAQALAEVKLGQFRELADTIERVADAMDNMPRHTLFRFQAVMDATDLAATAISAMNRTHAPSTATAGTTGATRSTEIAQVTVNLKLDSKVLEKKVISIHKTQSGIEAREALYNES